MRGLLRALGATVSVFLIVLFASLTLGLLGRLWGKASRSGPHVQVVEINGVLAQSQPKLKEIREAVEDKSTKALVVRVTSPGGLVAPSQELYNALRRADEKIPVVISMGPVAASGGYYLALGGRQILANPGSLTGSIGVLIEFVNTQKLYEWAKIERFTIAGGKYKTVGTPFRPMTPDERKLMETMVADIHTQFKDAVKERRGLTDAELENTTDGRVFTGNQALQAKLVDKVGDLHDAIELAKELASLPKDAKVVYPPDREGLLQKALFGEDDPTGLLNWLIRLGQGPQSALSVGGIRIWLLSPFS